MYKRHRYTKLPKTKSMIKYNAQCAVCKVGMERVKTAAADAILLQAFSLNGQAVWPSWEGSRDKIDRQRERERKRERGTINYVSSYQIIRWIYTYMDIPFEGHATRNLSLSSSCTLAPPPFFPHSFFPPTKEICFGLWLPFISGLALLSLNLSTHKTWLRKPVASMFSVPIIHLSYILANYTKTLSINFLALL